MSLLFVIESTIRGIQKKKTLSTVYFYLQMMSVKSTGINDNNIRPIKPNSNKRVS